MLRRIEGLGAGLLRRADRGEAAALARRALDFAGVAGAMLLLCRAQPAACCIAPSRQVAKGYRRLKTSARSWRFRGGFCRVIFSTPPT